MTPESKLKKEVTEWLEAAGFFFQRNNSGKVRVRGGFMQLCKLGTADFIVFIVGERPIWIELKAPGCTTEKKRKAAQLEFREKVIRFGHRHAQCTTLDEVTDFLLG